MKKRTLGLGMLALGMLSGSRSAFADEYVDSSALFATVGFGALDVGLATTDLAFGAQGKWPPRAYSAFEVAAAGAQIAICLDKALSPQQPGAPSNPSGGAWGVGAAFGAIFVAHGIVTLVAPRSHLEIPTPTGPVTVAPLALSDVARTAVPGMGVLGRF
ncbi:MAG TPA: hypothetical protein VI456_02365 [Polyangia bacterium]